MSIGRLALLVALGFALCTLQGKAKAATNGSFFLTEDFSSSSRALGSAVTARTDLASALPANPAAVTANHYMTWYAFQKLGFARNHSTYLAYAFKGWENHFAVTAALAHPVQVEEINDLGEKVGEDSVSDFTAALVWGRGFYVSGPALLEGVYQFGVAARAYQSRLFDSSATTPSGDVGLVHKRKIALLAFLPHYKPTNVSVGFSVLNLGPDVKYGDVSSPQPVSFRAGIAYDLFATRSSELAIMAEAAQTKQIGNQYSAALEYGFFSLFVLRGGYIFSDQTFNAGAGIRYRHAESYRFEFDYAFAPATEVGNEHSFGIVARYDRGLTRGSAREAREQVEAKQKKADERTLRLTRFCLQDYDDRHEKKPGNLSELSACLQAKGIIGKPQLLEGTMVYDPGTGAIAVVSDEKTKARFPDQLFLADGSRIRASVSEALEAEIKLIEPGGKLAIPRSYVRYAIVAKVSGPDLANLDQINALSSEVKDNTGQHPKDLPELQQYYQIKHGAAMPQPSSGEWLYEPSSGNILLINNYQ